MPLVTWLQGSTVLRQDNLPLEWCPWHVHFMCTRCGELWLHRLLEGQHAHTARSRTCPDCPTELEYFGLPENILNAHERRAGYEPIEILALEFLIASKEATQWLKQLQAN